MKQSAHFNKFYNHHVKLDQQRIKRLKKHIVSVSSFLKKSILASRIVSIQAQGSWRHGTMIQPLPKKEYDADILVILQPNTRWRVSDYMDTFHATFKRCPSYAGMVSRKTRCITLDYKGDFHLDVVPCVVWRESEWLIFNKEVYFVCNRKDGRFERTDGDGFALWLEEKKSIVPGANLSKVIQLLKYLRDHKQNFSVKSILLTTLIGNCIKNTERGTDFADLPTSLQTVLSRLDKYLASHTKVPIIVNPAYKVENFNRNWEEVNFQNFKRCIHSLRLRVDDAINERSRNLSLQKWQSIFGPQFGADDR
ncbi:SMODS domain-containing nucleotidyltransferase [Kordiimonas sp.]|uniref:SMODS domain-containing nucleotidyltransferase n=1 Tax=Kordiimonas sp. TaxID=1970157 RepID=UPI003B51D105